MKISAFEPVVRVLLRYASGALVSKGVWTATTAALFTTEEVLTILAGAILAAVTELWWRIAKKAGRPT